MLDGCTVKQAKVLHDAGLPLVHVLAMRFKTASDALNELSAIGWKASPAWCEKWGGPDVFKLRPDLAPGYKPGATERIKSAIEQLGNRARRGAAPVEGFEDLVGLVVKHRGHEMRLVPIGNDLWVADAEVNTPNGDEPYTTLDATDKDIGAVLDRLAAAMDRARATGERPDLDDDGNLIEEGDAP
jgi:hypothetical protein